MMATVRKRVARKERKGKCGEGCLSQTIIAAIFLKNNSSLIFSSVIFPLSYHFLLLPLSLSSSLPLFSLPLQSLPLSAATSLLYFLLRTKFMAHHVQSWPALRPSALGLPFVRPPGPYAFRSFDLPFLTPPVLLASRSFDLPTY